MYKSPYVKQEAFFSFTFSLFRIFSYLNFVNYCLISNWLTTRVFTASKFKLEKEAKRLTLRKRSRQSMLERMGMRMAVWSEGKGRRQSGTRRTRVRVRMRMRMGTDPHGGMPVGVVLMRVSGWGAGRACRRQVTRHVQVAPDVN